MRREFRAATPEIMKQRIDPPLPRFGALRQVICAVEQRMRAPMLEPTGQKVMPQRVLTGPVDVAVLCQIIAGVEQRVRVAAVAAVAVDVLHQRVAARMRQRRGCRLRAEVGGIEHRMRVQTGRPAAFDKVLQRRDPAGCQIGALAAVMGGVEQWMRIAAFDAG